MGIVFGIAGGIEEPAFRLVHRSAHGYEVRVLPRCVAATVHEKQGPNGNSNAFRMLAGYIGVTSAPKNSGSTAIAMTAPVVQTPEAGAASNSPVPIAMTAPVVQSPVSTKGAGAAYAEGDVSMAFLLPAMYTRVDQCPVPTDARIKLEEVGERLVAVRSFSGWVTEQAVEAELCALVAAACADGLVPAAWEAACVTGSGGGAAAAPAPPAADSVPWQVAQYNPPFTLPWLRRNEIWLRLDGMSEADVARALEA